jgi:hypothetical protein
MTSKLNNYHFGRSVFEYFPWYTYDNNDIHSMPKIDRRMITDFNFAFIDESYKSMVNQWRDIGGKFATQIDSKFMDDTSKYISVGGSDKFDSVQYSSFKETINDWEDIEKIRLRLVLGTEKKAKNYLKIIDFYMKYHDDIQDMVYTQSGEDIEVSLVNLSDFIERDNFEVYDKFIDNEDIISALKKNSYNGSFLNSVYAYYVKNGFLSVKQLNSVRKTLKIEILKGLKNKPLTFLYVKTNLVPNVPRVTAYFDEIKLNYKVFNNFILAY